MRTLSQAEADTLRTLEKYLTDPNNVRLPSLRGKENYPVNYQRNNKRADDMAVSSFRGGKNPKKVSYKLLYDGNIILVRVDTQDSTPHSNPDHTTIDRLQPHIHIYREGFGDKYAFPLPEYFRDSDDIGTLLKDFLSYSKILNVDKINLTEQEMLFDGY